jgi:hypothetical protein
MRRVAGGLADQHHRRGPAGREVATQPLAPLASAGVPASVEVAGRAGTAEDRVSHQLLDRWDGCGDRRQLEYRRAR